MLFHHRSGDSELYPNFVERQSIASVQHERCANFWCKQIERLLEILQTLLCIDLEHRIGIGGGERRFEHSCEIDQGRNLRLSKGVLLKDVLGDREKIGLRRTDRLNMRDAQHAQVHVLDNIGYIRGITHAGEQEPAQLRSVARC